MNNLLRLLREYWYAITGTFAGIVFLAALLSEPEKEDPTGGAGFYAAMLALCAAAIFLAETANGRGTPMRRLPGIFLGVVTLASAYLWIAAEADTHPANPELSAVIGLVWLACAVFALMVSIFLLLFRHG